MLTKLNNLANFLDNAGQSELATKVCDLASYCMISKYADLNPNNFFLLSIDDPELAKWDKLLLEIDAPSKLAYEIKGPQKAMKGIITELFSLKAKFNTPISETQRAETIKSLSRLTDPEIVVTGKDKLYLSKDYKLAATKIKPKFWGRALPVAGGLISVGLAAKNISEATHNARVIVEKLPLDKYGLSTRMIFSPAVPLVGRSISKQIEENKDNPENLLELLEVSKVISTFYIDFLLALTNSAMLVIDILTVISAAIDGPLPIADGIVAAIGFILSLGLIGVELGTEYLSEKYWSKVFDKIRGIASENIKAIEESYRPASAPAPDTAQGKLPLLSSFGRSSLPPA